MKTFKSIIFCTILFLNYSINAQVYFTEYDETIDKLLPKAKKNKLNEKQLILFTQSYHQANEEDHKRIMELKTSGQPDIWTEIYLRLESINNRQGKITTLDDEIKTSMNFKALNLDNEISNSKEKAELYICAKIPLLLNEPIEENITEATQLLHSLSIVNPQSNKLDEFRIRLVIVKSEHILFRIATPIELNLPENFAQLALDFDDKTIYGVPFDIVPDKNTDYDLMIRIMIEEKNISPERVNTATFEEKNNGKVATVIDKTMSKSANIIGNIEFIDVKNKNISIKTPFDISSTFIHHYAEIEGDTETCSEETLQLLNIQHTDFPSDNALYKDTARKLNQVLDSIFHKN